MAYLRLLTVLSVGLAFGGCATRMNSVNQPATNPTEVIPGRVVVGMTRAQVDHLLPKSSKTESSFGSIISASTVHYSELGITVWYNADNRVSRVAYPEKAPPE